MLSFVRYSVNGLFYPKPREAAYEKAVGADDMRVYSPVLISAIFFVVRNREGAVSFEAIAGFHIRVSLR